MPAKNSVFSQVAHLLSVAQLARPLGPDIQSSVTPENATSLLEAKAAKEQYDPSERVSLVRREGNVIGWVLLSDLISTEKNRVAEVARTLYARDFLAANFDALAAITLLGEREEQCFFVVQGNNLVGTLQYSDLFTPAFRLCLLALTLQVEECALHRLLAQPDNAIATLTSKRQEQAKETCMKRFGAVNACNLVRSTTLVDKGTMLRKLRLLPAFSANSLQSLFARVERLRNDCAHPDGAAKRTLPVIEGRDLPTLIRDCHELIDRLEEPGALS